MKKWIKKINIFMCCLLLCFCSVVAKPKEVQALIGVDDLALATIGLMGLSLLGIGITENINDNYDTYKKVALNTYNSMCEFVGQSWEDMCLSAYNTGQFALTQLNNVKSNIQDWYNSIISVSNVQTYDTVTNVASNLRFDNLNLSSLFSYDYLYSTSINSYNEALNCANNYGYIYINSGEHQYLFFSTSTYDVLHPLLIQVNDFGISFYRSYFSSTSGSNTSYKKQYVSNGTLERYIENGKIFVKRCDTIINPLKSSFNNFIYTSYDCIIADSNNLFISGNNYTLHNYYISYVSGKWGGTLELDPPKNLNNPLDGFVKLNDMVKGLDGVLDLDPISIGALNGTFEITDTTITNYGTISTSVLDLSNVHDDTYTFPLIGSLENTLDDTNTMVFNPTLDDDITNVGDITVTYPQNPSIPTLKDVDDIENIDDLKFDWTTLFPFCIPFDFIKFLKVLCSDPITPELNWNYDLAGFKGTLNFSLKDYNDVASLLRKMETFSFILFLIFKTRDLIRG